MLWAPPSSVMGNGKITTKGLISDADLVFDATQGATGSFTLKGASPDVLVHLDLSDPNDVGDLGLGVTEGSGGSVEIHNGATVHCEFAYLGYVPGSSGAATVDGPNATLLNQSILYVGHEGVGTLNIRNGATVGGSHSSGVIGDNAGSSGIVTVDGANSLWNAPGYTSSLLVGLFGDGVLEIANGGRVDSGTSTSQIGAGEGSSGMVVVDGAGSTWESGGGLYVSYYGHGELLISNGGRVRCSTGLIGRQASSEGTVVVDGIGSQWSISKSLRVGNVLGTGTLQITNGGTVVHTSSTRYASEIRRGAVLVDGVGSTWSNIADLSVGRDDGPVDETATLSITGGGVVDATSVSIGDPRHLLAVDVGRGSLLSVGGGIGTIDNAGTVRILAGAGVAAGGVYCPIAAGTSTGSGVWQAVGGVWDAGNHAFTVSPVEAGTAGAMMTIDSAVVQRVLISDDATGWTIGAGFLASATTRTLDFTATAIDPTTLADLAGLLEDGEGVRGAWTFETGGSGYAVGDPVYLSFGLEGDFARSDLNVWHFDGTEWTAFDPFDLTYDGQYASFTVTGFSGYAVSVVPEPGTLAMLVAAALGLLGFAPWRPW